MIYEKRVSALRKPSQHESNTDICELCISNCCKKNYSIFLQDDEIHLFENNIAEDDYLEQKNGYKTLRMRSCCHLSKLGKCQIYIERPFDCRMHPLMPDLLEDAVKFVIDTTCLISYILPGEMWLSRSGYYSEMLQNEGILLSYLKFVKKHYPQKKVKSGVTHYPLEKFIQLSFDYGRSGACRYLYTTGVLDRHECDAVLKGLKSYADEYVLEVK